MAEWNIYKITELDNNFSPTFADHQVLPDINFDGHCLINNNISISTKVINSTKSIYFLHTNATSMTFKHRF